MLTENRDFFIPPCIWRRPALWGPHSPSEYSRTV